MYKDTVGEVPVAQYYSDRLLSLPLHLSLTADDIITITKTLKAFYEQKSITSNP